MKFTDKENTIIADLGINTDYSQSPAVASQDIMKILGTTAGGANALLRSLHKKGVFVTNIDEEGEDAVQFTDKGKLVVKELSGDFTDDLDYEEDLEVEVDDDDEAPAVTMVQKAAKKAKAKSKTKAKASTATGIRTSHADCSHAKSGSEGKIARAKCRKERAAAAAKAEAKA